MQRRSFFRALALVAGYCGIGAAQAKKTPSLAQEPLEILPISAGPSSSQNNYPFGSFLVSFDRMMFIIPYRSFGVMVASEYTVHLPTGTVLKDKAGATQGATLEIPVLDYLEDHAALWPELDVEDNSVDLQASKARADLWVSEFRQAFMKDESQIAAMHARFIGKHSFYSDWAL